MSENDYSQFSMCLLHLTANCDSRVEACSKRSILIDYCNWQCTYVHFPSLYFLHAKLNVTATKTCFPKTGKRFFTHKKPNKLVNQSIDHSSLSTQSEKLSIFSDSFFKKRKKGNKNCKMNALIAVNSKCTKTFNGT